MSIFTYNTVDEETSMLCFDTVMLSSLCYTVYAQLNHFVFAFQQVSLS